MREVIVEKEGLKYKWSVNGLNEKPCVADIEDNKRTALTDYVATMFSERYGCVATVEQVKEMTHNEYQKFLEKNASRLYNEPGYTMEDYNRDADSVVILGFDLSKFGLSEDYEKLINASFSTEGESVLHNKILRGHFMDNDKIFAVADALGCECAYDNYYSGFFKNDESRLVFGFCEGDITLILCEDEKSYRAEYYRSCQFYKVEPDDVLEYDSENIDKWAESFDVASPQECANLLGKPVRDEEVIYYPENVDTPGNTVSELIADASARSAESSVREKDKEVELEI